MNLDGIKKVYFMGIGGSSMSSLAEILIRRGYTVAGSDMQESATVEHLRKFGAEVTVGQKAENVEKQRSMRLILLAKESMATGKCLTSLQPNMEICRIGQTTTHYYSGRRQMIMSGLMVQPTVNLKLHYLRSFQKSRTSAW